MAENQRLDCSLLGPGDKLVARYLVVDRGVELMHNDHLEMQFQRDARAIKLPTMQKEFRFHPTRRWRFDYAFPEMLIAVEIEGGTGRVRGRHLRTLGFREDCTKYNEAAMLGWMVLRGDAKMVKDGSLLAMVERAIQSRTSDRGISKK